MSAVLVPAIAKAVVIVGICLAGGIGAEKTVKRVVTIAPVAVGAVVGSEDVTVGRKCWDTERVRRRGTECCGTGLLPKTIIVAPGFRHAISERRAG